MSQEEAEERITEPIISEKNLVIIKNSLIDLY